MSQAENEGKFSLPDFADLIPFCTSEPSVI
jgi:hypothetical protein